MYTIPPNGTIRLIKDAPITGYKDTVYFPNQVEQANYFAGKASYTLSASQYTRHTENSVIVPFTMEQLTGVNYLMFNNSGIQSKNYYAFVRDIEYVNNNACEIIFEIDQFQTWFFNCTLHPCYIVRETSRTDKPGDNIVAENLDLGPYLSTIISTAKEFGSYNIVILSARDNTSAPAQGAMLYGMFSGLHVFTWPMTAESLENVNSWLNFMTVNNQQDAIAGIYAVPSAFMTGTVTPPVFTMTANKPVNLDGYVPKNKKLLTFPYSLIYAGTGGGESGIYRVEMFSSDNIQFNIFTCALPGGGAELVPRLYNGVTNNYEEAISIMDFPTLSFSIDSFKAWFAQNSVSSSISLMGSAAGVLISASTGNVGGAVLSGIGFAHQMSERTKAANMPATSRGNTRSNVAVANRYRNFAIYHRYITPEYAKIIDDYFSAFGYATERVKVPNVKVRKYWTYTQTKDCYITGTAPIDAIKAIENAFNSGIRLWTDPNNVGSYSLDNAPVEQQPAAQTEEIILEGVKENETKE